MILAVAGRAFLNAQFHLDNKSLIVESDDVDWLIAFVREAVETLAMVDYPYPSDFLAPLPGWPVQVGIPVQFD